MSRIKKCFEIFNNNFKTIFKNIKINLYSNLIPGSGLGSSASTAVSLVSAINEYYHLNLDRNKISEISYELEKEIHGKPSGIDNTTCTFGNIIYFKNGKFQIIKLDQDFNFLIVYTGIEHNTKIAIQKILDFKNKCPKKAESIIKEIGHITDEAITELKNYNYEKLGELMIKNQKLLSILGVSNDIIKKIINLSIKNGAYGAKLTGAGLGGCVIILGDNLDKLEQIFLKNNFTTLKTSIDKYGVKVEEFKFN